MQMHIHNFPIPSFSILYLEYENEIQSFSISTILKVAAHAQLGVHLFEFDVAANVRES